MREQSDSPGLEAAAPIRLFWANLDETAIELASLESTLAPDELRRVRRLRGARLRSRWIAARALLRLVLSRELGSDPRDVRLQSTDRGKPYLPGGEVAFNLSHSGPHLVIALAPLGRVGVDVECIRPLPELAPLVDRHFTGAEAEAILSATRGDPSGHACKGTGLQAPWQVRSVAAPFGAMAAVAWDTPELTIAEQSLQMARSA